jgi:hypothetical protein
MRPGGSGKITIPAYLQAFHLFVFREFEIVRSRLIKDGK